MTILDTIIEQRRQDIAVAKEHTSPEALRDAIATAIPVRDFAGALARSCAEPRIIAELKKASPSKGLIREVFLPEKLAPALAEAGAAALSVLTEPSFFQGSEEYLKTALRVTDIPVLRKDFIVDPYQLLEARAWGTSAVLLIVAALSPAEYSFLYTTARDLGLHVLTEVHDQEELNMVLGEGAHIVGVNSRDLKTFRVDLNVTAALLSRVPSDLVRVAESGVHTAEDIVFLRDAGANAFLIGESLMREPEPGQKLRELLSAVSRS